MREAQPNANRFTSFATARTLLTRQVKIDYPAEMTQPNEHSFHVAEVSAGRRPSIRQFIDAHFLPDDVRRMQWRSVLDSISAGHVPASGLLEACDNTSDQPLGIIWIQPQDGRVANLLAPLLATSISHSPGLDGRFADELLNAAIQIATAANARLVQALLELDAADSAERFRKAGFQQVAELLYLVSLPEKFPKSQPATDLEFEPWSAATKDRFEAAVERTYIDTRDCPQLNGIRPTSEVLVGYRSAGSFDPARWLLVRHADRDVGCLLIIEHPHKIWELAYMGLVPEARGHGWGLAITRHGQWLARQRGASRFVLAVDATNAPALRAYGAAGLETWDRRAAWLKILDPANAARQ